MSEEEARSIIRDTSTGYTNLDEYYDALDVAYSVLGYDAAMTEIWRWVDDS